MTIINHECYVSLEVAELLKKSGFNWYDCGHRYNDALKLSRNIPERIYGGDYHCAAPTLDVAQRWLRENKDFDINVLTDFDSVKRLYYVRYVVKDGYYKTYYISNNRSYVYFDTYEDALEAGIKKALELILEKGE